MKKNKTSTGTSPKSGPFSHTGTTFSSPQIGATVSLKGAFFVRMTLISSYTVGIRCL
jgi:hypothetical protein